MLVNIMFSLACLTVLLYLFLTILRAPSAWHLDTKTSLLSRLNSYEPKVSANLSNQFEWPMLFYACCLVCIAPSITDEYILIAAYIFLFGRILHSVIQIFTDNIRLRGLVFTINFAAVIFMWIRLILVYPHQAT